MIWGRYNNTVEVVDRADSAYLLAEYQMAFGPRWKLWRGRKKDEPKEGP